MSGRRSNVKWNGRRTPADQHSLKAKIYSKTGFQTEALRSLKNATPTAELFRLFPRIIKDREVLSRIHGAPFPRQPAEILITRRLIPPAPIASELIWAIAYALQYSEEIRAFVLHREALERAVLRNDRDATFATLQGVEDELGWSVWLIQNRLSAVQLWDGLDEKRKLARTYEDLIAANDLLSMIVSFIGKRTEGTAVPGYLQAELARIFPEAPLTQIQVYLKTKLFDLASPAIQFVGVTLSIEAQSGVVDYYETLVAMLQAVVADEGACAHFSDLLVKPVASLLGRTSDCRLVPVLVALGGEVRWDALKQLRRVAFIEAYSEGRYADAISIADSHLDENPSDISAFVLRIRAELKQKAQTVQYAGPLGEIAQHLRAVLAFTGDTYASALSLYTIYDRFYGHAWATYLRAIVMQELSQDQFEYPSSSLRRVLALDPNLTPFSALLEQPSGRSKLTETFRHAAVFSTTLQVYELATTGTLLGGTSAISLERQKRYVGRFQLANGMYAEAIANFTWCRNHLDGSDALRCSTAAVVAYIRNGDLASAVSATIAAYLSWPSVPTVLPLPELVAALESPSEWPTSISLPLIFELYFSFFNNDRITHLRYAFERFQTQQGIASPGALRERINEFGLQHVILYLSRVWRPEVMRQTILYEGTREIEEERIRVCRILAEIDPGNASEYLAEIRERVKAQELAKATNLVEQSRVYVDISAIKKALRTRLGDAYARYKSAMQTVPVVENSLIERLTDVLSEVEATGQSLTKMLSTLHVINSETSNSELDVQFAAMFAEVTNEFLRGDHGLNAYLSTRVRHGKLSNALRKPVADEFLVTERKVGTSDYVPNDYWDSALTALTNGERANVLHVLEQFAASIDSIIAYVRDSLIQVVVVHELVTSGDNPHALFVYQTSNLERMFVQASDRRIKHIDDFINLCVETLWEKTDTNLAKVQLVLNTDIRSQFLDAFDHLTESLAALHYADRLGELHNHIGRARTNIQTRISTVSSWFKRSEVYDRQDYGVDFPVLIARSMIENSISGATGWDGVSIKGEGGATAMPGRTLDGMVDVFCGLFENAIAHSGLSVDRLNIDVSLSLLDGKFSARVRNPVEALTFERRDENRLERIRNEIRKSDTRRKAQMEGRSGFHKLWATINAPQYRDPSLLFGFTDDGAFEVTIGFRIEIADDEDTAY